MTVCVSSRGQEGLGNVVENCWITTEQTRPDLTRPDDGLCVFTRAGRSWQHGQKLLDQTRPDDGLCVFMRVGKSWQHGQELLDQTRPDDGFWVFMRVGKSWQRGQELLDHNRPDQTKEMMVCVSS